MPRAHLFARSTDSSGALVPNTQVTLYEAGSTQLLGQTIYADALTATTLTNPFTISDGTINFYLTNPQSVKVGLRPPGGTPYFTDHLDVLPPAENMVRAATGFQITNAPISGQFLQASGPGTASWTNSANLVSSRPSPLVVLKSYDFSGSSLADLIVRDVSQVPVVPTFTDVTADAKPAGYSFSKAMQLPTTKISVVKVPSVNFTERGSVVVAYKVMSAAAGVGAAILHIGIENDVLFYETPVVADLVGSWQVAYLDDVPLGTHTVSIAHRPGSDPASVVLLGPLVVQVGNNIPPHTHAGTAPNSTLVGDGAAGGFAGATVIGAGAQAVDVNACVFGAGALGAADGLALGVGSQAGPDAVAIGYQASGPTINKQWVALGRGATVTGDAAVAIGAGALAAGARSVALGAAAATGSAVESVALGPGAQATGLRSVALGQGAVAAQDYALAIGPGAVSTAAHQAVIGDGATTVVIPGSFRQVGGDGLFAGSANKLGFFGSTGVARPVITGSRGGNATVTALLSALSAMGLVQDSSTP